jgi:hypothetical protein
MNTNMGGLSWPNLRLYHLICLEGEDMKTLIQGNLSLDQNLTGGPPEDEVDFCDLATASSLGKVVHWIATLERL